jgi:hypothetical protein
MTQEGFTRREGKQPARLKQPFRSLNLKGVILARENGVTTISPDSEPSTIQHEAQLTVPAQTSHFAEHLLPR